MARCEARDGGATTRLLYQSEFGAEVTHVDMRLEVGAKLLSGSMRSGISGHQAPDNATHHTIKRTSSGTNLRLMVT